MRSAENLKVRGDAASLASVARRFCRFVVSEVTSRPVGSGWDPGYVSTEVPASDARRARVLASREPLRC